MTQGGYCQLSGLGRDRVYGSMTRKGSPCCDMVFGPSTRLGLGARDGRAHAVEMHSRMTEFPGSVSRQGSPCCDMVPKNAEQLGSQHRLSLSRQSFFFLALCRDSGPLLRQVLARVG